MSGPQRRQLDPELDLMVERVVRVSPPTAWAAWTRPEHVCRWYAPSPGTISDCQIDLRPGGMFRFTIRAPEGDEHQVLCCYLEVEPFSRLVWTDAVLPGYRPAVKAFFTAVMTLEPHGDTTLCTTVAMHRDKHDRNQHAEMGFHEGWGTVLDQLVAYAPTI